MRRRRAAPPRRFSPGGEPDLPSLHELERFNEGSVSQWLAAANRIEALYRTLYFELESLRQRDAQRLIDAIRSCTRNHFECRDWSRIVDYRFALEPHSTEGSVKNEGRRFNIGAALSPGAFSPFPALHIAWDYATAFLERLGNTPTARGLPLAPTEFALRRPESFTQVRLRGGMLENVLDVGDLDALRPVANILRDFPLPKAVGMTARKLGLRQSPWLIRSPVTLQRQLVHPNWRMLPMQFDLPPNPQIFGRLTSAAGVHGILYPSARDSNQRCLALLPQNLRIL